MVESYAERVARLPQSEDLGNYVAKAGGITAELSLRADIHKFGVVDSGTDWYIADFHFYTNPKWQGSSERFSARAHYSSNSWSEVFDRVKKAERGISEILGLREWETSREIIACLLDLEKQTQEIPSAREEARKERNVIVYGREDLRAGID